MAGNSKQQTAANQEQPKKNSVEHKEIEDVSTIANKAQTLNLLKSKGLTLTILFQGSSLNYGEGFGNYSELKKLNRYNGVVHSVSSRQSLRYSIFIQGVKEFGWKPSHVRLAGGEISNSEESGDGDRSIGKKTVTQLLSTIRASPETDLFGYFDTNIDPAKWVNNNENSQEKEQATESQTKTSTTGKAVEATVSRTSAVRISPAISLEAYQGDTEMLTNKYQGDKIQAQPNIASSEIHQSIYCYTISIDLHRVGTEQDMIGTRMSFGGGKDNPNASDVFKEFQKRIRNQRISYEERKQRVLQLLDIIGRLYRDIRGRREDLKPLFVIGGVYEVCNPFFSNIVRIDSNKFGEKDFQPRIKPEPIVQLLKDAEYTLYGTNGNDKNTIKTVRQDTFIGIRDGFFNNKMDDFSKQVPDNFKDHVGSPECAISKVKEMVERYYNTELANDEKMINAHAAATNSST